MNYSRGISIFVLFFLFFSVSFAIPVITLGTPTNTSFSSDSLGGYPSTFYWPLNNTQTQTAIFGSDNWDSGTGARIESSGDGFFQDLWIKGNLTVADITSLNVTGDLIPYLNDTFNLGNSTNWWDEAYITEIHGDIEIPYLSGSTYKTLNDWWDTTQSAGKLTGGDITDNGDGTIAVSSGNGIIKSSNTDVSDSYFFHWNSVSSLSLTDKATNYIYVDYNSGSPQIVASTSYPSDHASKILLGLVYRDGTDLHMLTAGQYIPNYAANTFFKDMEINGKFQRVSGFMISEKTDRKFAISSGSFYAGLTKKTFYPFDTSSGDTFTYLYRDGTGGWTKVTGQTQIDNLHYDDGSGTLAELSSGWGWRRYYGVHWVYVDIDNHVYVVYGQGNYLLDDAYNAQPPSELPQLLTDLGRLVGKIIIEKNSNSFEAIQSPFVEFLEPSVVQNHNNLAGLQGGAADEYYHLNENDYNARWQSDGTYVYNNFGNIGIGTTNPNTLLSIYKDDGGAKDMLHLRDDADTNDFYIYYDGTNYQVNSENGGSGYNWLTLANDGKVGIKTTSPSYQLDINGNAGVRGSLQLHGNNIELNTNGGNSIYATTDTSSNNYATHITNKGGVIVEIDGDNNAGSSPDNDVFKVKDYSSTLLIAKASNNYVGINTASPSYTLDVNGNTRVNGYLFLNNDYSLHTESSDVFKLIHDSSYVMSIDKIDVGTYDFSTILKGDLTLEQNKGLYFKYSSSVIPSLTPQSNSQLRLTTNYGYLQFGPANTGWAHFSTDRPAFYFNKPLVPSGAVRPYTNNAYNLGDSSHYWNNAYIRYLNIEDGGYIKGGKKHYMNANSFMYATDYISKSGSGEYIYTTDSNQVALYDIGPMISVGEEVIVKVYAYSYGDTNPTAIKILKRTDNPSSPNTDYSVVTSTYTRTDRGSNAMYTMNSFTVSDGYMYFLRIEFPASSYFRLYGISIETKS